MLLIFVFFMIVSDVAQKVCEFKFAVWANACQMNCCVLSLGFDPADSVITLFPIDFNDCLSREII